MANTLALTAAFQSSKRSKNRASVRNGAFRTYALTRTSRNGIRRPRIQRVSRAYRCVRPDECCTTVCAPCTSRWMGSGPARSRRVSDRFLAKRSVFEPPRAVRRSGTGGPKREVIAPGPFKRIFNVLRNGIFGLHAGFRGRPPRREHGAQTRQNGATPTRKRDGARDANTQCARRTVRCRDLWQTHATVCSAYTCDSGPPVGGRGRAGGHRHLTHWAPL